VDPTAIRMVSVDLSAAGRRVQAPRPVVVIRHTPAGVPYEDAFLPAEEPGPGIHASLLDGSGPPARSGPLPVLLD
jgi:hypothetical protein